MEPIVLGVILAAGKSTRMGRRKASLPVDDHDTYLTRLVRTYMASGLEETIVVLGHERAAIEVELARSGLAPRTVVNEQYESGQLSSLIAGLNAVDDRGDRPACHAMVLGLVDAPFVSPGTIRALVERYARTGASVIRPVRGPRHGHPVLIDRSLFTLIRHAADQGAKPIIRAHVTVAGEVEVDDEGAFMDIDVPDDHERAIAWLAERGEASR